MISVSAGYKHRDIAIGAKKKEQNKQTTFTTKKAKEKFK
jgi:hypothetical protein